MSILPVVWTDGASGDLKSSLMRREWSEGDLDPSSELPAAAPVSDESEP